MLYGASLALMVRGDLGLAPWDVLHSGLIQHVPITLGQAVVVMSFVVLLLLDPAARDAGIGTIANAFVVGFSADATLWLLDAPGRLAARVALTVGGVALCGLAHRHVHRRPARPRPARRADDRPRPPYRYLDPAGPHRPRGHGRRWSA